MQLKAKIIAVEEAMGGVIVVIQQEKMRIPVAEDDNTSDEAIFAKKFARSMKGIGLNIEMMRPCEDSGFRTGFWMQMEEYEELGKPTIGDIMVFMVKLEK